VIQPDGTNCRGNFRLWLPPSQVPAAVDIKLISVDDIPMERLVIRAESDGISWGSGMAGRAVFKNWSFGYDHYRGDREEKNALPCMIMLPADPFRTPSAKVTRHRYVLQLSPAPDFPQAAKATTHPTRSLMQPLQLPVKLRIEGQLSGDVVWASAPDAPARH
jgi:hypothetical protein